jgi:hypothetical protein
MSFTNTKGGWKYRTDVSGRSFYIETVDTNHDKTFIGDIGGGMHGRKELEANAKLIAAAPDLYNALNELIERTEELATIVHLITKEQGLAIINAKEAIKRATL